MRKTAALSFFVVKTALLLQAGTSLQSYFQQAFSCSDGSKQILLFALCSCRSTTQRKRGRGWSHTCNSKALTPIRAGRQTRSAA